MGTRSRSWPNSPRMGPLQSRDGGGPDDPPLHRVGRGGTGLPAVRRGPLRPAFSAPGHRVIMPDLRGHGASGRPHEASAYPPDVLADDGLAVVSALGLSNNGYDLFGYSMGGRVVLRMLVRGARPASIDRTPTKGSVIMAPEKVGVTRAPAWSWLLQNRRKSSGWLPETNPAFRCRAPGNRWLNTRVRRRLVRRMKIRSMRLCQHRQRSWNYPLVGGDSTSSLNWPARPPLGS